MQKQKKVLVNGIYGFIGHHIARKLKQQGHFVVGADIKPSCEFSTPDFYDEAYSLDLRLKSSWKFLDSKYQSFDEVYNLAADMGGSFYIFTGENDANVMHNSALINLHAVEYCTKWKAKTFYSSSACMYPAYNQEDPNNPNCKEDSAYPANPDSEYGWEKLFSERLYLAFKRNHGLNVKIARFHNIMGEEGSWTGGKEKAPAALCRKIAEATKKVTCSVCNGTTEAPVPYLCDSCDGLGYKYEIDIWGDGKQTRSFLYIDECVEGILRLMESEHSGPVNIGSEEMVTINQLAEMIAKIANKKISINHIPGPLGVRGRNSDNKLIKELLNWAPSKSLYDGLVPTYNWIKKQVEERTPIKT